MQFIITKSYGTKSPYEWLARTVKEHAKEKYGLDVTVTINPKYLKNNSDESTQK